MRALYLYDDSFARMFEPFALTRPVSELRAGAEIIRLRWEKFFGMKATGFIGSAHLKTFSEFDAPAAVAGGTILKAGSIVANSRFVVSLAARAPEKFSSLSSGVRRSSRSAKRVSIAAVRLSKDISVNELADGKLTLDQLGSVDDSSEVSGRWLDVPWELIYNLSDQLNEDITALAASIESTGQTNIQSTVIGGGEVTCEAGAKIEPFVVFDTSGGPIMIRRGATVASFTRIVGPAYIGENSSVVGDQITVCSIGNSCKVRGEISNSIMLGHSNKGHYGFVGQSYIGRWVNLGAGTTTSNLKNTYGTVQMWGVKGMLDTGLQFLGTFFGDHVKTGIGTMLNTGTVLGAGANIFGAKMPPKYVPPFSWGDGEPYATFEFHKFLDVAKRMMERRQVELGRNEAEHLKNCFTRSAGGSSS